MPDIKRPRLGRRAVHRDPLCAVCEPSVQVKGSSNEQDSVIFHCTAVGSPCRDGVHQVRPFSSAIVDVTTVPDAGDQLTGDEVYTRIGIHQPWIVVELAAPLLGISRRPELNGFT